MSSTLDLAGRRWTLGELLGEGGFGRVFAAYAGDYTAAVKLVPEMRGASRETLLAEDLRGTPHVLPVWDVGQVAGGWALIMPRAAMSLEDLLRERVGGLPEHEALPVLRQVAAALNALAGVKPKYSRELGVVHRDLKPGNVLLHNGSWHLSDFGTARYATAAPATDTRQWATTPAYRAPEQWRGEDATSATDVYAFGLIAYELLTGRRPFTEPEIRRQHLIETPPPLPDVSIDLARLVIECLFKDPRARPSTTELPGIIDRIAAVPSSSPGGSGLAALRAADLAASTSRGVRAAQEIDQAMRLAARDSLLRAAGHQLASISTRLRIALESASPGIEQHDAASGWCLELNGALLTLTELLTEQERPQLLDLGGPPRDTQAIASAYIAVFSPTDPARYAGRAHALWFVAADTQAETGWFEVGFAVNVDSPPLPRPNATITEIVEAEHRSYIGRGTSGLYEPIALNPWDPDVPNGPGSTAAHYVVQWPPTSVRLDNIDTFIDRWADWFARASLGQLQPGRDLVAALERAHPTRRTPPAFFDGGDDLVAYLQDRDERSYRMNLEFDLDHQHHQPWHRQ